MTENVDPETAAAVRILYGGSVSAKNCNELIAKVLSTSSFPTSLPFSQPEIIRDLE